MIVVSAHDLTDLVGKYISCIDRDPIILPIFGDPDIRIGDSKTVFENILIVKNNVEPELERDFKINMDFILPTPLISKNETRSERRDRIRRLNKSVQ